MTTIFKNARLSVTTLVFGIALITGFEAMGMKRTFIDSIGILSKCLNTAKSRSDFHRSLAAIGTQNQLPSNLNNETEKNALVPLFTLANISKEEEAKVLTTVFKYSQEMKNTNPELSIAVGELNAAIKDYTLELHLNDEFANS